MKKFLRHISLSARRALHCKLRLLSSARNASFALLTTVSFALAVLCTACAWMHEDQPASLSAPDSDIRIYSRASGGTDAKARFDLWYANDYNKFLSTSAITEKIEPFFETQMSDNIDEFCFDIATNRVTPFSTYRKWPDQTSVLYASGVAPESAIDGSKSTLETIYITTESQDGLTDILASNNDGHSHGSFNDPFVLSTETNGYADHNEERELKFRHLTAAIVFKGKRAQSMTQRIGVREVRITINNKANGVSQVAVPTSLKRYVGTSTNSILDDHKAWTYVVNETSVPDTLTGFYPGNILMDLTGQDEAQEMVTFYGLDPNIDYKDTEHSAGFDPFVGTVNIDNPKPKLTINVKAVYFLTDKEEEIRIVEWKGVEITNWLSENVDPTGNKFMPAHKYEVTIEFDSNSVGLRAELVPWVEKGPYYYPVLGTTDNPVKMELFTGESTTSEVAMKSLDDKVYATVHALNNGQKVGFRQNLDYGEDTHLLFDNCSLFGNPIDNEDYNTDHIVHYTFNGETGDYLIILDKVSKSIVAYPTSDANGYYLNEQKLTSPYTDVYVTPQLVKLVTPDASAAAKDIQEYDFMYFDNAANNTTKPIETVSLVNYDLSASPLEYNSPTYGMRVSKTLPTPVNGLYHIIIDTKSGNEAVIAVPVKDADDHVLTGWYLGDQKFPDSNMLSSDQYKPGQLVALTNVASDGTVSNIKFKTSDDSNSEHADWFTVINTTYLEVDDNGTCRFTGTESERNYRFALNTTDRTLDCVYLDPSMIGRYMLNGTTFAAPYSTVAYLHTDSDTPMALSIIGDNYEPTAVNYSTDWTLSAPLATTDGASLKLQDGATEGWYSITFNMTAQTVTATRVRNAEGDPIEVTWEVNNNTVDGGYYCLADNVIWASGEEKNLTITRDEDSNPETVDYSTWIDANAPFTANASHTALVLKQGQETGKYIVQINTTNRTINGYCLNGDQYLWDYSWSGEEKPQINTEWTDAVATCYSNEQMAKWSSANLNDKVRITLSGVGNNCKIRICYNTPNNWETIINPDLQYGATQYEYTITEEHLSHIQTGGIIVTGFGGFYVEKIDLIRNNSN